ncbi:hypothetical protein ACWE42_11140 [Sutcliffiella cohnii]
MIPKVTGFAYTSFLMPEILKNAAQEYINKHYGSTVVTYKKNLLDLETLNNLVNLDCMNCHLAHQKLCCEGPPYSVRSEETKVLNVFADDILRETLTKDLYIKKKELINRNEGVVSDNGDILMDCEYCIFFNKMENGSYGCLIHSYALKNDLNYTEFKPSSCLIFPMDVLTLDNGGLFLFGLTRETAMGLLALEENGETVYIISPNNKGFSRWTEHDLDYLCTNINVRYEVEENGNSTDFYKSKIPNNIFEFNKYKPLFEEESQVIDYLFGKGCVEFIKEESRKLKK